MRESHSYPSGGFCLSLGHPVLPILRHLPAQFGISCTRRQHVVWHLMDIFAVIELMVAMVTPPQPELILCITHKPWPALSCTCQKYWNFYIKPISSHSCISSNEKDITGHNKQRERETWMCRGAAKSLSIPKCCCVPELATYHKHHS